MCPPKTKKSDSSRSKDSSVGSKPSKSHRSKVDGKSQPWESASTGLTMGVIPAGTKDDVVIDPQYMTPEQLNAVLVMAQKKWIQKTGRKMTKEELKLIQKKLQYTKDQTTVDTIVNDTIDEMNVTERAVTKVKTQEEINGGVPTFRDDIQEKKFKCRICHKQVELHCLPFHEAVCLRTQPPGSSGYKPK